MFAALGLAGCVLIATSGSVTSDTDSPAVVMTNNYSATGYSSHCRIHALIAAASSLGIKHPPELLFDRSRYVSHRDGSDLNDLESAAKSMGLATKIFRSNSVDGLIGIGQPTLVQLSDQRNNEGRHWFAVLGQESGKISVFENVLGQRLIDRDEFAVAWDGGGMIVAHDQTTADRAVLGLRLFEWFQRFSFAAAAVLGLMLVHAIIQRLNLDVRKARACLLAVIGMVCLGVPTGFAFSTSWKHRTSNLLAGRRCWKTAADWQQDDKAATLKFVRSLEELTNPTIVDCRLTADYRRGHIPNAINLPLQTDRIAWQPVIEKSRTGSPVILYCQSAQCRWAEIAAGRLACLGIESAIYSGGYQRFQEMNDGHSR